MKRILGMLISLSIIFALLASCAKGTDNAILQTNKHIEKSEYSSENEPQILQPNLPDRDFEGYNFRFLVRNEKHMIFVAKDIFAESENGDIINDAVYRRNKKIEEQFNINISQEAVQDPGKYIQKIIQSGDDAYDAFIEATSLSVELVEKEMVVDLNEVPFLDFTKPWWDVSMTKELSIGNKLYCNMGELIISDNDGTWGVLFNKDIIQNYDLESPYKLVREGKWTIDKMHEMSKVVAYDINGDGKMSVMDDRFGFATEPYNTFVMIVGAGERIAAKADDDYPVLTMNTPRYIEAYEKALSLNTDKISTVDAAKIKETPDPFYSGIIPAFNDGRILFYMGSMALVPQFRNMEQDFGLLPTPKLDEKQDKYYTTMSIWNNGAIYVPVTNSNLERTGIIIEALSAESMYTLTPAYYDISLKTKFARDDESAEMLDIIFQNRIIDIGATYNLGKLFDVIFNGKPEFISEYEKREEKALNEIEELKR
ncbi:MAG: hypothetical protein AB9835_11510 [Eubacteriales bacterium]